MEYVLKKPSVLVCDDDLFVRKSLSLVLGDLYRIIEADSMESGLASYEQSNPDLVTLDIRMPGMSGIEGLREIRRRSSTKPVVMLTAYASVETAQEAIRLGATDYLVKPFATDELKKAISQALQKSVNPHEILSMLPAQPWQSLAGRFSMPTEKDIHPLKKLLQESVQKIEPLFYPHEATQLRYNGISLPRAFQKYLKSLLSEIRHTSLFLSLNSDLAAFRTPRFEKLNLDFIAAVMVSQLRLLGLRKDEHYRLIYEESCICEKFDCSSSLLIDALSLLFLEMHQLPNTFNRQMEVRILTWQGDLKVQLISSESHFKEIDLKEFTAWVSNNVANELSSTSHVLAVTYAIAQIHRGKLKIKSAAGLGTIIEMIIPKNRPVEFI